MYFKDTAALQAVCPVQDGVWDRAALKEYMVQSCCRHLTETMNAFMAAYRGDRALAELLLDFLLDDAYDGSDCQIGAAVYLARMEEGVLRRNRERLLRAQANEVYWKRPFRDGETPEWL